ncbi:tRNA (adenosine(37)-N6)-threonylcarbamoyltransferase complex ATPase subunit type 1 TsaE [Patescibacteria group bacterium]|nr:tRNA (adenosine(37)-N6)-threonylcarbamoyltransferase complex ATPase subunit type 1 TsaE [Patescibacteria group bacterium]
MLKKRITNSARATQKMGENLVKQLIKSKKAVVIGLEGDLGSGKTTFLQGFAKGLGVKEKVLSPTFVILKRFKIKGETPFDNFYHIDCYRLQSPKELVQLGFEEIISNPENIIALEWADKIRDILPSEAMFIKFKLINKNKRQISFAKVSLR